MSTPDAETKPAEEQVLKEEAKQETSTASEEVQIKEEKEVAAEPSTTAEPSNTAEPSTAADPSTTAEPSTTTESSIAAEPTAMEVDSSLNETKLEAISDEETKPAPEADGTMSDDAKANNITSYRLSGASLKRFNWLVDQGYEREEAAQLARKLLQTKEMHDRYIADTMKAKAEKEALQNGREPMNTTAAKRSSLATGGPPSKVSKSMPEATAGIPMAVAAKDYPATSLTNAQTDEVKSAILKKVLELDSELKPRFESCVHVKGYLRVICSDQDTCQWLQGAVAKLTVPEGISLKMVAERNVFKGDIYFVYFTDSRNDTNEAILGFVNRQNDGIDTSKWKIVTRKEVENTQTIKLEFTVDQSSFKSIRNLGYELNYKFNKIKIGRQNMFVNFPGSKNVRTGRSMAPPQRRPFNQPRPASNFIVPVWDRNLPQRRSDNNFDQFDNPRDTFSSGSGNYRIHEGNSFGMGDGGSGSFRMGSGDGNNFYGGCRHGHSNSFGGSNNNFGTAGRSGNQNSNHPFDLAYSLHDHLELIDGGNSNQNNNSFGSSRRIGGGNTVDSNQWRRNTVYDSGNSSYSGRSISSLGNRNFFTTTRSGFF